MCLLMWNWPSCVIEVLCEFLVDLVQKKQQQQQNRTKKLIQKTAGGQSPPQALETFKSLNVWSICFSRRVSNCVALHIQRRSFGLEFPCAPSSIIISRWILPREISRDGRWNVGSSHPWKFLIRLPHWTFCVPSWWGQRSAERDGQGITGKMRGGEKRIRGNIVRRYAIKMPSVWNIKQWCAINSVGNTSVDVMFWSRPPGRWWVVSVHVGIV